MRSLLTGALISLAALPALADATEGSILAFDRRDGVLVMSDQTVWQLPADLSIPADLGAGDRITIEYTSGGDNGVVSLDAITRLAKAVSESSGNDS